MYRRYFKKVFNLNDYLLKLENYTPPLYLRSVVLTRQLGPIYIVALVINFLFDVLHSWVLCQAIKTFACYNDV